MIAEQPDKNSARTLGTGTAPMVAGLAGFVVGQLVGDKAVTLARGALRLLIRVDFLDAGAYERDTVAEAALFVILIMAAVGAALGIVRTWGRELRLAVFWGIFAALFVIVEYSLPVTASDTKLAVGQPLYFWIWAVGLWLVPLGLLPHAPGVALVDRITKRYDMLVAAAGMTVVGLLVGVLSEKMVGVAGWFIDGPGGGVCWNCKERFWVARPVGVNAICGPLVVVALANVWCRELEWKRLRGWTWTAGVTTLAAGYSGLWGVFLYSVESPVSWLGRFVVFAGLPMVGVVCVVFAYTVTQQKGERGKEPGWPVSGKFWWLLPMAFSVGCGANAWIGLALIGGPEGWPLVAAHMVNGAVLGGSFMVTKVFFAWAEQAAEGVSK